MAGENLFDLKIDQGTSYTLHAVWTEDGVPVDTSGGWTGRMQARQTPPSTTVLIEASTSNGKMTISDDGVIEINFTPDETNAIVIPANVPIRAIDGISYLELGVFDLELTDTDDIVIRLVQGKVYLSAGVTR